MKKFKKAFTIVELVIVIAVIAILAAVLIPTFSNIIRKANISSDTQLVRNLNTALVVDRALNGEHKTMHSALQGAFDAGYDIDKINARANQNEILWDSVNDVFCYYDVDQGIIYTPDVVNKINEVANYQYWKIVNTNDEEFQTTPNSYSIYAGSNFQAKTIVLNEVGFDAGNNSNINVVNYFNNSEGREVIIRTNGGTLNIGTSDNIAKGQIHHYGVLKDTTIFTESNCFHTYGAIGNMNLKEGKAIAEKDSLVYLVTATTSVEIEEKDNGKFFIPAGTTQAEDGTGVPISVAAQVNIAPVEANIELTYEDATKQGGNVFEIGSLSSLEQYRDLVNTGFNFTGITVRLVADITLNDGWTPIGEGARKSGYANDGNAWAHAGTSFEGTFDGNGHTIYNLNNKGFVPSANRLGIDGAAHIYSYGFIGQSTTGAKVINLTFRGVDIDTSRYSSAFGDSVGSVIGFCAGGCELSGVSVYGSIKAYEAVGGLIGRAYNQDAKAQYQDLKILECNNYANVECFGTYHAAGLIGYISNQSAKINNTTTSCYFRVTVSGCYVQGQIKTNGNDLSGLFNSAGNDSTHIVKENEINCQLVYTGINTNLVKWAAYISSGSSTFGTGEEANAKGNEFSAMVNNVDLTSTVLEH